MCPGRRLNHHGAVAEYIVLFSRDDGGLAVLQVGVGRGLGVASGCRLRKQAVTLGLSYSHVAPAKSLAFATWSQW